MMEGRTTWLFAFTVLATTLTAALPRRNFGLDLKEELNKLEMRRLQLENLQIDKKEEHEGLKTARMVLLKKNTPEGQSGDTIDNFFNTSNPDPELLKEVASFVLEDGANSSTAHHPQGVAKLEQNTSKAIGNEHDSHPGLNGSEHSSGFRKRSFPLDVNLWPDGVIPYEIDSSLTAHANVIYDGIAQFNEKTCIRWVKRDSSEAASLSHSNYVRILSDSGCYSYVGMVNVQTEGQYLSLDTSYCISWMGWAYALSPTLGFYGHAGIIQNPVVDTTHQQTCLSSFVPTVVHEMAHAIGQFHEINRSDRDDYITMKWDRIITDKNNVNIKKMNTRNYNQYDLESVLQYGLWALSDGTGRSMEPVDNRLDFLADSATGLSFIDVKDINTGYNCSGHCVDPPICQNGGFVIHNCTCFCPEHLTGTFCETPITDSDCGGIIDLEFLQTAQIQSPDYPNNYILGKKCVWVIKAPVGYFVKLTINELILADNGEACYHWLEMRYNNIGQTGPRVCTTVMNEEITTTKDGEPNLMMLVFDSMITDRNATKGFDLTVKAVNSGCAYDPCVLGSCTATNNGNFRCACEEGVTGRKCNTVEVNKDFVGCPFEDGSHCFMKNSDADNFDWSLETTYTMSADTGPLFAHEGAKYLYIEASWPRTQGEQAVLISDVKLNAAQYCLSFWYHMYGSGIGSLKVQTYGVIWEKNGNQGDEWKRTHMTITGSKNIELSFIGEVGQWNGDIAIDDVKLYQRKCDCSTITCANEGTCEDIDCGPVCHCVHGSSGTYCEHHVCDAHNCIYGTCAPDPNDGGSYICNCQTGFTGEFCHVLEDTTEITCTFENSECFVENVNDDTFDWRRHSGSTGSSGTGPSEAHAGGYYMYAEASSPRQAGDVAVLKSFVQFSGTDRCLRFYYHMYGTSMGTLDVVLSNQNPWSMSGDQGDSWHAASINVPANVSEVQFKAVRGSSYTSDIAVDDITLTPGLCN